MMRHSPINAITPGMLALALLTAGAGSNRAADAKSNPASVERVKQAPIRVRSFLPEQPISRAQRPTAVAAVIENAAEADAEVKARLVLPAGVRAVRSAASQTVRIESAGERKVVWQIEADAAGPAELRVEVSVGPAIVATTTLPMQFLSPVEKRKLPYIPEPAPVQTPLLIGAHHCPLWEADKPNMWANLHKHPERTPALGFYAQENLEVSDW